MIINNINPVIVSIGPFSIRYYGLVYVIGFLIAYWWLSKNIKKGLIKNMNQDILDKYITGLIISIILGARIFEFIFYETENLISNPISFFKIWQGGLSFHGGLVGAAIITWWFSKKYDWDLLEIGDLLVIPAAFALFLGRIANFINSELVGTITKVPWCVNFNHETTPTGELVCRHPSQIYEAIKNLIIFFTLIIIKNKNKKLKKGFLFWLFITLYAILRIITDFWRDDPRILLGLNMGQLLSLAMAIIGLIVLIKNYLLTKNNENNKTKNTKEKNKNKKKKKNTKTKKKTIKKKRTKNNKTSNKT